MSRSYRIVALDRDGVLNGMNWEAWPHVPWEVNGLWDSPCSAEKFYLLPGAAQSVRRLNEAGIVVVLYSNQPGQAMGKYSQQDFAAINDKLASLLAEQNAWLDKYYYCLHGDKLTDRPRLELMRDHCPGRKPNVGLLLEAQKAFGFGHRDFVVIGDSTSDIGSANKFGCDSILVRNQDTERWLIEGSRTPPDWSTICPTVTVEDIAKAVDWILD